MQALEQKETSTLKRSRQQEIVNHLAEINQLGTKRKTQTKNNNKIRDNVLMKSTI